MRISGYFPLPVINAALINLVSRQKVEHTGGLMEPSCFKRATSRVKRWKGERLRHHRTSPVWRGGGRERRTKRDLYEVISGRSWPDDDPSPRERKLKVADRRPTDIEITSSIKVHSGLIFIGVRFKIRKLWF